MNKCICKNNDNLCTDKIKCNTVYFFLNLKYDILRQKSTIIEIQNSLINHNNQVNNMLNTHIINNNNMINNNDYIQNINFTILISITHKCSYWIPGCYENR